MHPARATVPGEEVETTLAPDQIEPTDTVPLDATVPPSPSGSTTLPSEEQLAAEEGWLPDDDPAARQRFLGRHPEARGYADFKDFAFYRLVIGGGHLVAGFGRIVDLDRKDLVEGNVGGGASEEDRQAG